MPRPLQSARAAPGLCMRGEIAPRSRAIALHARSPVAGRELLLLCSCSLPGGGAAPAPALLPAWRASRGALHRCAFWTPHDARTATASA